MVNLDGKLKEIKPSLILSGELDRVVYQDNSVFANLVQLTLQEESQMKSNTDFFKFLEKLEVLEIRNKKTGIDFELLAQGIALIPSKSFKRLVIETD